MIKFTKTFSPPQEEYQAALETGWVTNRGVLVQELESKLKAYLCVSNIIAMTNGTLPLQIAIKTLNFTGEIITTPFSYVATASSIAWKGCISVFVDIHLEYLTIDESKIEAAITQRTSAILATHVFGNPCHVEAIEIIAKKSNLKVVYDAAHCFGITYKGQSVFNYGDVSTCSFHATKLFHTGEGGALIKKDKMLYDKLFYHHNFGHDGPEKFQGLGINAKMSEPQAAMGLSVLPYMETIIKQRQLVVDMHNKGFEGVNLQLLKIRKHTMWNYCYYPIIFKDETQLLVVKSNLEEEQIFPRRYFYPSLDSLPYVTTNACKVTRDLSSRVLCLPLYLGLQDDDVYQIINIINKHVC